MHTRTHCRKKNK